MNVLLVQFADIFATSAMRSFRCSRGPRVGGWCSMAMAMSLMLLSVRQPALRRAHAEVAHRLLREHGGLAVRDALHSR